jgi:sRNA-binding protein
MLSMPTSAQPATSPRGETVDLQITVAPCVAHLEQRLREIIAIELRTSARVDEHAALTRFHAWVRCVRGGVLLEVRSEDGEAEAAQRLSAAAMRGPDPARTLALSLVELLEPALAEAEAESAARAAEARAAEARAAEAAREAQEADEGEDAAAEGETASPEPEASARGLRTWGLAAELSLRVPMGSQPHMGGVRVRGLRALTDRVRVEFGGQLERGRRRVSLGRVVVTALALDLSVLLSVLNGAAVGLAVGAGARLGGLFWRGQPNADDVTETRLRSAHLELFARAAADWYVARRWALRLDLELGGVLVGSRAVVVDNAASNGVAVSGFRAALALGVVHAF